MSNSDKYIPKVGEECEMLRLNNDEIKYNILILGETDAEFWIQYLEDKRTTVVSKYGRKFRSIPTKADVEREKLLEIVDECYDSGTSIVAKEIQNAGFTIPKKVKREDLEELIDFYYITYEDKVSILRDLCELLGDLVEDEA